MTTEKRMKELAYYGALWLWSEARTKKEQLPTEWAIDRERKAWEELERVTDILYEVENSQSERL